MMGPYEQGRWDMFSLITSVYFGKECYILYSDGTVYSRKTHRTLQREEALQEFLDYLKE